MKQADIARKGKLADIPRRMRLHKAWLEMVNAKSLVKDGTTAEKYVKARERYEKLRTGYMTKYPADILYWERR